MYIYIYVYRFAKEWGTSWNHPVALLSLVRIRLSLKALHDSELEGTLDRRKYGTLLGWLLEASEKYSCTNCIGLLGNY